MINRSTGISWILAVPIILGSLALGVILSWTAESTLADHATTDYYSADTWDAEPVYSIGFRDGDLDTAEAKTSILSGDDEWDFVSGATIDFLWDFGEDSNITWDTNTCTTVPNSGPDLWILTDDLSGSILAFGVAESCGGGPDDQEATIRLDDSRSNWYTGSGSVPGGKFDLRSVATHEFGHVGFFGQGSAPDHFPSSLCSGSSRQTMCSSIPSGTSYMRTLESHDEGAFADAY